MRKPAGAARGNMRTVPGFVGAALRAALLLLFLIANRGAYQGYFSGDDLNNLGWTRHGPPAGFARDLLSPRFYPSNYRPLGRLFYALMGRAAGLEFRWYVAAIHLLHFINVWLAWLLARRLGLKPAAATAGALFFAFHMGVFDALWKPMYIFDLLCALLCLLSLLAYAGRRWLVSLALLWLAYKAKEVAVMLPAVLALYEHWFGERRWRRLAPFFGVSLLFGLQALVVGPEAGTDYILRLSPEAQRTTLTFYSSLLFLAPYLGLAVAALPLVCRDRRLYFGLAALGLLLLPMLLLPGRLSGGYLYLPLAGAAVAFATLAGQAISVRAMALVAGFFVPWIPWNYARLRVNRRATLAAAEESRNYASALLQHREELRRTEVFIYDGVPRSLSAWGVQGIVQYLFPPPAKACAAADPCAGKAFETDSFAVLQWDPAQRDLSLLIREPGTPEVAYFQIRDNGRQPVWQLEEGWFGWERSFRWIAPYARARLRRPAQARAFELVVHIGPDQIRDLGRVAVEVLIEGQVIGRREFTAPVVQPVRWDLPAGPPGTVRVEFRVTPEYRPPPDRPRLGIPIAAFGFLEE